MDNSMRRATCVFRLSYTYKFKGRIVGGQAFVEAADVDTALREFARGRGLEKRGVRTIREPRRGGRVLDVYDVQEQSALRMFRVDYFAAAHDVLNEGYAFCHGRNRTEALKDFMGRNGIKPGTPPRKWRWSPYWGFSADLEGITEIPVRPYPMKTASGSPTRPGPRRSR